MMPAEAALAHVNGERGRRIGIACGWLTHARDYVIMNPESDRRDGR